MLKHFRLRRGKFGTSEEKQLDFDLSKRTCIIPSSALCQTRPLISNKRFITSTTIPHTVRELARILEWLSTTSREYVKAAISQGPHPIGIRVSVEVNYIRCEVVPDGEQVGMKCTGETESTLKMSAVNIVGLVVPPVLGSFKSPQWGTLNMPHRGHQFQSKKAKVHDK